VKRYLLVSIATLLAGTASAGVRIETVHRDMKTLVVEGTPQVVLVQDGKVKFSGSEDGSMILKDATLFAIDDKHKTYREMDKATMQKAAGQANDAMAQLRAKMEKMPPEQRAQMEKMMGKLPGAASGTKSAAYEAKDMGKTDTSEGRKCHIWNILKDGTPHEELCVVPFSSLPGKEDMQKTFKELAEAFKGLTPSQDNSVAAHSAVNGYAIRVRTFDKAGTMRAKEMVLKSWTEVAVPASSFEVPAGYKKQELPSFGKP
jgi:hypothetical protein